MATTASQWRRDRSARIYTRREIEGQIAEGRAIIIVNGEVMKCDAWMPYHPGGDKAIRHMIGRDATDEVNALHSTEARKRMESYVIGRVEGRWENFTPPIQGGRFRRKDEEDTPAQDAESSSSTEVSSAGSSPMLLAEDDKSTLRRRKEVSPPSSVSSADLDEPISKMTYLDRRTEEELKFDAEQYPSVDPEVQDEIIHKYRLLNERIKAEGLYQCNYSNYVGEFAKWVMIASACIYALRSGYYKTSAVLLGCFWHQLVFSAHDAGHMGITHNFHIDSLFGILISDYFGGLSMGWWKRNHNVHHIVTNSPEHDPDIQHLPFFAISHRLLGSLRSTYYDFVMHYDLVARTTIRIQHYLYYVILSFGRFNLYRLSWVHLIRRDHPKKGPAWWHYWVEVAGQFFFWGWFGYGILYRSLPDNRTRLAYVVLSHLVTSPVHVQITLSHFGMSTADLGQRESFPQKMLRTTMDVDCPAWLDWFHGGLQFQVVHHLFPRIPRHNLRRTQRLVQEFCEDTGIPYALYGFVDGNKQVIGRLGEVARQARILAKCQQVMVAEGDLGLH